MFQVGRLCWGYTHRQQLVRRLLATIGGRGSVQRHVPVKYVRSRDRGLGVAVLQVPNGFWGTQENPAIFTRRFRLPSRVVRKAASLGIQPGCWQGRFASIHQ